MTTEREQQTSATTMCCRHCGKVISKETTLSGILDFVAGAEATGWTFNENGFVCCPECSEDQRREGRKP